MPQMSRLVLPAFIAVVLIVIGSFVFLRQPDGSVLQVPVAEPDRVPTLEKPVAELSGAKKPGRVFVKRSVAEPRTDYLRLKGRTAPVRIVSVSAETTGVVVETPVGQGELVKEGDILCALDPKAAQLKVEEAKTAVTEAERKLEENAEYVKKGWKAPKFEEDAKTALERARANLSAAQLGLQKTNVTAPFDGLFEKRAAEMGDFLSPGDDCGILFDLDPLLAIVEASEEEAARIREGAEARVAIGAEDANADVAGKVQFIASSVDPASGLYRLEVAIPNETTTWRADLSVEVRIAVGRALAHFIGSAQVQHAEDGRPYVRYVGVDNKVKHANITVIESADLGVWATGLPEEAFLVLGGQGDLPEGRRVEVVVEDENS